MVLLGLFRAPFTHGTGRRQLWRGREGNQCMAFERLKLAIQTLNSKRVDRHSDVDV